jgi:cyclophilin family peptidyl-prolyl cis-trans isomerase
MYRKISLLIFVTSCAMILSGCSQSKINNVKLIEEGNTMTNNTTPTSNPATPSASAPEMEIDTKKSYSAVFKTDMGEITVELNAKETPITVNNFVHLARNNFYDNTVFHRTISGFMIQGGDPKGDGTGGPGYKFADEPFEGEYTRGTIAMANSGPNTNGSQFFIMHQDYPLPKNYVIFGKVTKGLDVVDKIANATVKQNPYTGEMSVPVNPVKVSTIEIVEK